MTNVRYTITGEIINSKNFKNNVYHYWIKDSNGNTEKYTLFGNGNNGLHKNGLDNSRIVTIQYSTHVNDFGTTNRIDNIEYGKYLTDHRTIADVLRNKLKLPKLFITKLIEKYGNDTLNVVFNQTEKIRKDINHRNLHNCITKINDFNKNNIIVNLYLELSKLKIPSKYYNTIPSDANLDYIKSNIYVLYLDYEVPFDHCDTAAMILCYDRDDPKRINSFITMLFKMFNNKGTLYVTVEQINQFCIKYRITLDKVLANLKKIVFMENGYYTTYGFYELERQVEDQCMKLLMQGSKIKIDCSLSNFQKRLDESRKRLNKNSIVLDDTQKMAIINAINNNFSIITGSPGTGKSTLIDVVIDYLIINAKFYVLAPTGAAVERLRNEINYQDAEHLEFRTLHSFVYINKMESKDDGEDCQNHQNSQNTNAQNIHQNTTSQSIHPNIHNSANPNPCKNPKVSDEDTIFYAQNKYEDITIFVDEMSMVDLKMFRELMTIVSNLNKNKRRLVLLGDKDQLPSIKGGNVLNDLINSRIIPTTILQKIYRQNNNCIPYNARLVLEGKDLEPDGVSLVRIEINDSKGFRSSMVNTIKTDKISINNSTILIPTRKRGICTNTANVILQNLYNPNPENIIDEIAIKLGNETVYFRKGDKIMHGKNNKKKDIYNGSILVVDHCEFFDHKATDNKIKTGFELYCNYYQDESKIGSGVFRSVSYFVGTESRFASEGGNGTENNSNTDKKQIIRIDDIQKDKPELAYAMTVHKAQGKGYDYVILIIHSAMSIILSRNLLYTAITRAKKKCIIIADDGGLLECKKIMNSRMTTLFHCDNFGKVTVDIFDALIFIKNKFGVCLGSPEIVKLLCDVGVRVSKFGVNNESVYRREYGRMCYKLFRSNVIWKIMYQLGMMGRG